MSWARHDGRGGKVPSNKFSNARSHTIHLRSAAQLFQVKSSARGDRALPHAPFGQSKPQRVQLVVAVGSIEAVRERTRRQTSLLPASRRSTWCKPMGQAARTCSPLLPPPPPPAHVPLLLTEGTGEKPAFFSCRSSCFRAAPRDCSIRLSRASRVCGSRILRED